MIICDLKCGDPARWLLFRRDDTVGGLFPYVPSGAACTPHLGDAVEEAHARYGVDRIEVHLNN